MVREVFLVIPQNPHLPGTPGHIDLCTRFDGYAAELEKIISAEYPESVLTLGSIDHAMEDVVPISREVGFQDYLAKRMPATCMKEMMETMARFKSRFKFTILVFTDCPETVILPFPRNVAFDLFHRTRNIVVAFDEFEKKNSNQFSSRDDPHAYLGSRSEFEAKTFNPDDTDDDAFLRPVYSGRTLGIVRPVYRRREWDDD